MAIIDEIKVERYLIAWTYENDYPEKEPFYARFGILETPEQEIALTEALEKRDEEWIDFDENIFYWLTTYTGETIEQHTKENPLNDFYYVGEINE
jgi:hypothetical protein